MTKVSAGHVLLMPKGDYLSSATYVNLDMVRFNDKNWICKKTCTNEAPADGEYWYQLCTSAVSGGDTLEFTDATRELKLKNGSTELSTVTIPGGGDVDQTYSATSTNAQSGKAVAEAVGSKVDKAQGAGNAGKALVVGSDGNVTLGAGVDIATSFSTTTSDSKVPSEKLVKTSLDSKADKTLVNNAMGTSSAYSPSKSYAVDDYCIYSDKLYCCILATTAGTVPTNTTYWKEVSLSSLNSNLNWKLVGSATGKTAISLPSVFNEILICTKFGNVWFQYLLNKLQIESMSTSGEYIATGYGWESEKNLAQYLVTPTSITLHAAYKGTNNYDATATTNYYYR